MKRELVVTLRHEHGLSERRACAAVNLRRSVHRYRCRPNRDGELVELLLRLAHQRPEEGFPKLFKRLRRQAALESQTGTSRVLQPEIEQKRERQKTCANKMPFSSDGALWDGLRYRTFNVVDDFNRVGGDTKHFQEIAAAYKRIHLGLI